MQSQHHEMEIMSLRDVSFKDCADPQHSACHVVGSQFMMAIIMSSHFQVLVCSWGYLGSWVKISNDQSPVTPSFRNPCLRLVDS